MIIAVAAIWDKRKGLDDVIALSQMIDDQIIVVGVSEHQKELLPSKILSITKTEDVQELRRLYCISDVLINPTYEDNYPTINLEAIACGTPVITYETGGSPESAMYFGAVVNKGNIQQLKAAISEIGYFRRNVSFLENNHFIQDYMNLLIE